MQGMKQRSPGPHSGREVRWSGMAVETITDTFEAAIRGGIARPPRPDEQVTLTPGALGVVGEHVETTGDLAFYDVRFPALDLTVRTPIPGGAVAFTDTGTGRAHHAA